MYGYVANNPLKFVDPNGEDIDIVVSFRGNFTDEEKKKILAAVKDYLSNLDVGNVSIRDSGTKDTRSWKQFAKDLQPGNTGYFKIDADLNIKGTSTPSLFKAGDLDRLRKTNPESFVAKVADGILHEVLAHQLSVGNQFDTLIFGAHAPGSFADKAQKTDPYFQTRQGTLMDHAAWRTGDFTSIRPLYKDDQTKIEERLKPINRKYD